MQTCLTKLLDFPQFNLCCGSKTSFVQPLLPCRQGILAFPSWTCFELCWVTAHGSDRLREWSETRSLLGFSQDLWLIQGLRLAPLNIFIMLLLRGPSIPNVFRIFGFHELFFAHCSCRIFFAGTWLLFLCMFLWTIFVIFLFPCLILFFLTSPSLF